MTRFEHRVGATRAASVLSCIALTAACLCAPAVAAVPAPSPELVTHVQHARQLLEAAGYSVEEEEGEAPYSPTLQAQRGDRRFAVRSYGCFEAEPTCNSLSFEYMTSSPRRPRRVARSFNSQRGHGSAYGTPDGPGDPILFVQHFVSLTGGIPRSTFKDLLSRWEIATADAHSMANGASAKRRRARFPAGFTGVSPEVVAQVAREMEFGPADIRRRSDRFRIYLDYSDEIEGEPQEDSFVELADCAKGAPPVRCATLSFRFDGPRFAGADAAREDFDLIWNQQLNLGRMTKGPDLEMNLTHEEAAAGGLTHENLKDILRMWVVTVDRAKTFQGTYPD